MLTTSQQQVAIVVLIVALAIFVLLNIGGGVLIYLLYTRGYAPIALFLLLPILWVTVIFFPLIVLVGAAMQDFDQRHEPATVVTPHVTAPEAIAAPVRERPRAPAVGRARNAVPAEAERFPGGTAVPTA